MSSDLRTPMTRKRPFEEGTGIAPTPSVNNPAPLEGGKTRVKVVVRVRPTVPADRQAMSSSEPVVDCTVVPCAPLSSSLLSSGATGSITLTRNGGHEERGFSFDEVLKNAGQDRTYDSVARGVVDDVLAGMNGTVLCYGQTGAGKTFTVFGPEKEWLERDVPLAVDSGDPQGGFVYVDADDVRARAGDPDRGIIPRALQHIFDQVERDQGAVDYLVSVALLQIYMENIVDLLDPTKSNLQIREHPEDGIFVDGLTRLVVHNATDALELIREGGRNRAVNTTAMNKVSTRSHVVLMVSVEQRPAAGGAPGRRGVLTVVDLAGSERVNKSGSEGLRLEEAKNINKSLSALGNCVASLASGTRSHVPFRDSKLTRLLTDSLSGNARTCLCANISPAAVNYDENNSTLLFAKRAMAVRINAKVNEVVDMRTLAHALQGSVSQMEEENRLLRERAEFLQRERDLFFEEISNLQQLKDRQENLAILPAPTSNNNNNNNNSSSTNGTNGGDEIERLKREHEAHTAELTTKFHMVVSYLKQEITSLNGQVAEMTKAIISQPILREKIVKAIEAEKN